MLTDTPILFAHFVHPRKSRQHVFLHSCMAVVHIPSGVGEKLLATEEAVVDVFLIGRADTAEMVGGEISGDAGTLCRRFTVNIALLTYPFIRTIIIAKSYSPVRFLYPVIK